MEKGSVSHLSQSAERAPEFLEDPELQLRPTKPRVSHPDGPCSTVHATCLYGAHDHLRLHLGALWNPGRYQVKLDLIGSFQVNVGLEVGDCSCSKPNGGPKGPR